MTIAPPERVRLTDELTISRILTGLWQVADMERDGTDLDPDLAAEQLADYAVSGFDTLTWRITTGAPRSSPRVS